MNTNRRNIVSFYLKDMIIDCNYKYNTKQDKSYYQFHTILCKLQELKIINSDVKLSDIKPSDRITCTLDINLDNQFSILYDKDKNKILNQTIDNTVDNKNLLIYFCYLNCKMYRRPKDDNINFSGGRSEVCWPSFLLINKELGFVDSTIDKYNNLLVDLDLIRIGNAGLWYYQDDPNKSLKESCNIYALFNDEETTKHNLDEGIKYYKKLEVNSNKVFKGTDVYKNNNRILNGELGSIVKKEKLGTATIKDIVRKNEILASTKPDEQKYKMMALLDAHPNEILSDVLGSDKYYDLENSLGLLDEHIEGKLADGITYDNYRWVMINYKSNEHQKFVDWVNNKKTPKKRNGLIKKQIVVKEDVFEDEFTPEEIQAIHEIDALNYDQIPEDVRLEMAEREYIARMEYEDEVRNHMEEYY